MAAYPKHQRAVELARADIGKGEVPLGSNSGPYVAECFAHTWLGRRFRGPWCVAAWQRWIALAGFRFPYKGAGAYALLDWARAHGYACHYLEAEPGDAVIFNTGAGHLAMLARPVHPGERTVHTIDGNVSNRVEERERRVAQIRGCVHLPEHKAMPAKTAKPRYEVLTSADGHSERVVYRSGLKAVLRKLPELLRRFRVVKVRAR